MAQGNTPQTAAMRPDRFKDDPTNCTVKRVLRVFGTQSAVARALDVEQPSVARWVKQDRIPIERQWQLRAMLPGWFK